jgi:beta-mannosidase
MTCGPWRPINLEFYSARISDVSVRSTISDDLGYAEIEVTANVECESINLQHEISVEFALGIGNAPINRAVVSQVEGLLVATATFRTKNPKLWYPAGYGNQPIYEITAELTIEGCQLDSVQTKFGLRKARVIQRSLEEEDGKSFFFEINNIPIFCGGSNWIPADNFIPRIKDETYYKWLKLARDGNQVMIRVWGGGIYEEQAFYDTCDELGLLVWQDFMFACGNYPAYPDFLDLVKREATENVKRLRHHPSIVIWAGNNEDYQVQEAEKLEYDEKDRKPESWLKSSFPARYIYEKVLSDVCKRWIPDTYYSFSSPIGGKGISGSSSRDPTRGDIHQWNGK